MNPDRVTPLVVRNRDFGRLWLGQVLNQAGQRVYEIAMVWWVLSRPGDSAEGLRVGALLVVSALPSLVLFRLVGRFVDSTPSRRVLVGSDWIASLGLGLVAYFLLAGALPLWGAYVAGLTFATLQAFVNPTLNKAVPETVAPEDVERAVTFQTSTQAVASFAGAAGGAILIDSLGVGGVALVTAMAYVGSSVCNLGIRFRAPVVAADADEGSELTGWQIVKRHPLILRVLLASGAINFFSVPTLVILPLYVRRVFEGSASLLGTLEAALWLGLVIGAFVAPRIRTPGDISLVGFVCLSVMGAGLVVPGVLIEPRVYVAALALVGAALGFNNVKFVAFFHQQVEDAHKGRFFALLQALIGFTFPVAYLAFGALADLMAPYWLCVVQGLGILLIAPYFLTLGRFQRPKAAGATARGGNP